MCHPIPSQSPCRLYRFGEHETLVSHAWYGDELRFDDNSIETVLVMTDPIHLRHSRVRICLLNQPECRGD